MINSQDFDKKEYTAATFTFTCKLLDCAEATCYSICCNLASFLQTHKHTHTRIHTVLSFLASLVPASVVCLVHLKGH